MPIEKRNEKIEELKDLIEQYYTLFQKHPSVDSEEYLKMTELHYAVAKLRKEIECSELMKKHENGELAAVARNSEEAELIYKKLQEDITKYFESDECIHEEMGHRWALKQLENVSSPLSENVPEGVLTDIASTLNNMGISIAVDESVKNKKQGVKETMLNRSARNNQIKSEIKVIHIELKNLLNPSVQLDDVVVRVLR